MGKAKNADGTIMGMQQMFMNSGQAIGPLIGGALYSINRYAPFLYIALFEGVALVLNIFVFYRARETGEVERSLFDVSQILTGQSEPLPKTADLEAANKCKDSG